MVKTRSKSKQVRFVVNSSDGESGVGSRSTQFAVRRKFDGSTLKQLAEDIERAGGIKVFDKELTQGLNVLLDRRTYGGNEQDIYGERGSDLRQRIRKKVAKWKLQSTEEYLVTLAKLGVPPSSARRKEDIVKLARGKEPRTKNDDDVEAPVRRPVISTTDFLTQNIADRLNKIQISKKAAASTIAPASKNATAPASQQDVPKLLSKNKKMTRTCVLVCGLLSCLLCRSPVFCRVRSVAIFDRRHPH